MPVAVTILAGHPSALHPQTLAPACQLSVVVPVFNEEAVIALFQARLLQVLATCPGGA